MIKRNSISSIRRKTHRNVDRVIDKAESTVELGKEKIEHLKNNVDGYIQKNPEKTALVAAGIGLFVGAILAVALIKRK